MFIGFIDPMNFNNLLRQALTPPILILPRTLAAQHLDRSLAQVTVIHTQVRRHYLHNITTALICRDTSWNQKTRFDATSYSNTGMMLTITLLTHRTAHLDLP
jgi:hypothetical protein